MIRKIISLHQIAASQELIGGIYTVEILARNMHKVRQTGTSTYIYSIKAHFTHQLIYSKETASNSINLNGNAQLLEILYLTAYNLILWQTELRNTIGKYTASYMESLKNSNLIAHLCQISSTGQTRRASTNNSYLLSILGKLNWLDFLILGQLIISSKPLQTTNTYWLPLDAHNTMLLALILLWADTTTYSWQGIGLLDNIYSGIKIPLLDFANKSRNIYLYRTALTALWHLTVKTAFCLSYSSILIIAQCYLLKITSTNLWILLRHLVLFHY